MEKMNDLTSIIHAGKQMQTFSLLTARLKSIHPPSSQLILPHKVKMQFVHVRLHASYFLLPWKIPEEISRRSMLFNN